MEPNKNRKKLITVLIWGALACLIFYMVIGSGSSVSVKEITFKDFLQLVQEEKVQAVSERLGTGAYYGQFTGSTYKASELPQKADFSFSAAEEDFSAGVASVLAKKASKAQDEITQLDYPFAFTVMQPEKESWLAEALPLILEFGILIFFMLFILRQQGGGRQMTEFSKAHVRTGSKQKVTFKDVAGADEEKAELQEIVEFMRAPQRFTDVGAHIPKGVLLVGPPGTGKTLLAKAVAGEAGVPFFSISGSDFVEMFVGVGASRVRDLFNTAKKSTPAVIFIDEIDAVGRQRGAGLGGGHDEREQTLNQLLVEMDGFAPNQGIIVIAATNRPDILDPALLRRGRFDRQITVGHPDVKGREAILRVHAKNKKFESDVDLAVLARRTPGFSGADLENVLNEAAILTARDKRNLISMNDVEEAITRVQMGPEKKSRVQSEEDKRYTAYHEAGHAILAIELEKCDNLHEVSIISRGMAAGYTMTLPKDDWQHVTKRRMEDSICMCMGGRVAEKIVFDDVSTGASQDLKHSTATARRMVEEYGMSETLGPVFYGGDSEVFIAKDWGHSKNHSDAVASRIDAEIQRILEEQYNRALRILEQNRKGLDDTAALLQKYERVTGEQFEKVYRGEDMDEVIRSTFRPAPHAPEVTENEASNETENGEAQAEPEESTTEQEA